MKNRPCENFSLFFFLATLMVNLGCSNSSPSRKIASSTSSKPSWINQIPKKTGYKFYIGRSSNSESAEDGMKRATQDAYNQVIREDFGVETKIDIKSLETMKDVHYSKSVQESSEKIKFLGFKRENFHVEKDNDVFNVWVLFKYSLKEMNKEKKRISAITKEKKISKKNYVLGRIEYEKGNHAKTRRLWKRVCDAGNMEGCNGLVWLERERRGHREKLVKINQSYQDSCSQGNMENCFNLAWLKHEEGNIAKAKTLYTKACEGGVMGCSNLGLLEVKKGNIAKARKLFTKACEGGVMAGCSNLGLLEVKKGNIAKARKLYTKSCEGGYMLGCSNLGALEYKKGNIAKARKLFTKACEGGVMVGCGKLGVLEEKKGNITKARKLYTKLCEGGEMGGCNHLGLLEEKKGNIAKARKLWRKACDKKGKYACQNLQRKPTSTP